jgi:hypothetical protein
MVDRAGNRSGNIFGITVAGQHDRGEKERNQSNTVSGGHCPTGTVTAHLNLEAKEWGALRFQIRPGRLVAAEREYGQKDLSPYNRARGKSCSRQSKISAND